MYYFGRGDDGPKTYRFNFSTIDYRLKTGCNFVLTKNLIFKNMSLGQITNN